MEKQKFKSGGVVPSAINISDFYPLLPGERIERKEMTETTEQKLESLGRRLLEAIEESKRAQKGSDKTWRRECKQEVENIRNLIGNVLAYREHQAGINVHGR